MSIRVFLADDHEVFRDGLASLLAKEGDISVVGEASDGRATVSGVLSTKPDVVLMDVTMPALNGIEVTRQLSKRLPTARVIGLSMHSGERFVREMLRAGAVGYLSKKCDAEEVLDAIRRVARGESHLSPAISGCLLKSHLHDTESGLGSAFARLTDREREILQMLAEEKSAKDIAAELKMSAKTVFVHRENIMEKLGIRTIAGLTKYAVREGLTDL